MRPVVALAAVVLLAGCGGNGDGAADDEPTRGDADAGREVFTAVADPACGSCHTLADADAAGTVAPNLDELQPSAERVEAAVRSGPGIMPSYAGQLSDEQIADVAAYVAEAASG